MKGETQEKVKWKKMTCCHFADSI